MHSIYCVDGCLVITSRVPQKCQPQDVNWIVDMRGFMGLCLFWKIEMSWGQNECLFFHLHPFKVATSYCAAYRTYILWWLLSWMIKLYKCMRYHPRQSISVAIIVTETMLPSGLSLITYLASMCKSYYKHQQRFNHTICLSLYVGERGVREAKGTQDRNKTNAYNTSSGCLPSSETLTVCLTQIDNKICGSKKRVVLWLNLPHVRGELIKLTG